jgi:hypothetical protein
MRDELVLHEEREQQHAAMIGGVLNGIFMIMKIHNVRHRTVTTYPPSPLSLKGSSEVGSRFLNGNIAETLPHIVVNKVIGKVRSSAISIREIL